MSWTRLCAILFNPEEIWKAQLIIQTSLKMLKKYETFLCQKQERVRLPSPEQGCCSSTALRLSNLKLDPGDTSVRVFRLTPAFTAALS